LTEIPPEYNVICVAFMETGPNGIPTFAPKYIPEDTFIAGVAALRAQGRTVVLSLGGADGYVALRWSDKEAFQAELIRLTDYYGFNGLDLDLEGESVGAADNAGVIPAALRAVKSYYQAQGRDYVITLAPEFNLLRGDAAPYRPYLEGLNGAYDLVFPQYYNQGGDGIWSEELNVYLSQNDNTRKAQFLYALTHALVTGTQDFLRIPPEKFAIGLPASPDAAFNGYVQNPADVQWALDRLAAEGNPIRGLMTWSVNQDFRNGYEFARRYGPMVGV
jgi:chitinase